MHTDWLGFLREQGAPFPAHGDGVLLADLCGEGLIRVRGADARDFLQGQLSSDLRALSPERSQLSAWNSAKGRVISVLRVFQRGEAIYLALPAELVATVMRRLALYILRAKVTLDEASGELARLGLAGEAAPELLATSGVSPPAEIHAVSLADSVTVIHAAGDPPRFVLCGPPEQLIELWRKLRRGGAQPVSDAAWALLKILSGEPTVYAATSEHFVAQMLNLDGLGAVSFNKGCYLGQEIIARAHYRGTIKRHLRRARSAAGESLSPGTPLHVQGSEQIVGEIVDARRDVQGLWQMLIVLQDEHAGSALSANDAAIELMD